METDSDLQPLNDEEIREKMKELPGWDYKDNKIEKTFEFPSFSAGVDLIVRLAPFCNNIDHHPDIYINYKKVSFALTRYSIGGKVTERDFTVARKIEELFKNG